MCNLVDIDTLARTIYGEARGESRQGKIAVACVILNRVKRKKMCGWREINGYKVATVAATCLKPWQFSCWNKIMTSDKIIYLFGKIIPKLSLLLTMSLGVVLRFKNKFYEIRDAQRCVGNDMSSGKITERLKKGIKILSLMLSWALDDAVYISESMKSRGYGLRKRTNFAIYRIKRRDFIAMALIIILSVILIYGILSGGLYWQYFPYISGEINGINTCFLYVSYIFLCFMPLITDIKEGVSYGNI